MTFEAFALILAAALGWNGLLNLRGPDFILESLAKWGFPHHFNIFIGIWEILSAALLVSASYRNAGAAMAAICLLVALTLIARDRQWLKLEYPLVLFALSITIFIAS